MHELVLPLNSKKLGGFRSYLRGGLRNSKRYKCSDVRSSGSRARPVSKEVIPDGRRDVARWAVGGGICPHYGSKEEGVGGPPSPAVLGRERQGRLIGTCPTVGKSRHRGRPRERCTFSPSPVERIRLDLSPAMSRERERVCGHHCRV